MEVESRDLAYFISCVFGFGSVLVSYTVVGMLDMVTRNSLGTYR